MANTLASDVVVEEEKPTVRAIVSAATSVLGAVGITQRGPVAQEVVVNSFPEFQRVFGDYITNSDAILAVQGFFDNGGTELHFVRTVHFTTQTDPTTKTSAAATYMLLTASSAASAGSAQSTNTAPFGLHPGETVVVKVDGGSVQTFTFLATAATKTAGTTATYALTDTHTLQLAIDGGSTQTVTFTAASFVAIGAATAQEVANVLNAYFAANGIGAFADVTGNAVRITSNKKGTGSHVAIIGGTDAAAFSFPGGTANGTGNVANIASVTSAEALAVIAPTGATVTAPGGAILITSNTTGGASSIQVTGASTAAAEFGFDTAVHSGSAGGTANSLGVVAKTDGAFGNGLKVVIATATNGLASYMNLSVLLNGVQVEAWPNVNMTVGSSDYIETIVNDVNTGSNYIAVTDQHAAITSPGNLPALGTFGPFTGGVDGLVGLADGDFVGGAGVNGDVGLRALDEVQTLSLLIVPGRATASVHNAMITYCEITRNGQVFSILDPPANQSATQIVTYVKSTANIQRLSEYAAIYWPRIIIDNPSTSVYGTAATITAPPSGALAGMFARNDNAVPFGVFQAPAGTENGKLFNVRGLEMSEVKKKPKREIVFPELINPISTEPGQPIFVDGARCLKDDGNWPTIGERRGIIFLETSLRSSLAFMRHRNISDRLLGEGRRSTFQFMINVTDAGALASKDPSKAFVVDFGPGLNTAVTKKARTVKARLAVATAEPAEFVFLLVSPDTRALDDELAAAAAA